MLFLRTFGADIRRILYQKKTWISITLIVLILAGAAQNLIRLIGDIDVLTICSTGLVESASFVMTTAVLPIFVYSAAAAEDRKNNSVRYFASRSGIRAYAISKFLSALVSAMLTFAIGMVMTVLIFSIWFPLYNGSYNAGDGYFPLVESGKMISYFIVFLLHYMLSAACFSATWFLAACCFEETFVAYTLPIMIFFFLQRAALSWNIPYWAKPGGLIQSMYDLGSVAKTFWYRALILAVYCLVLGLVGVKVIERKIRNT